MNVQLENPEKREAILNSTLNLICDNGFHAAPMSQIAQNAGVAAGTIYHYFASKELLITALFDDISVRIEKIAFEGIECSDIYETRFFSLWVNLCSFYIENPKVFAFIEQYTSSPFFTCNPAPRKTGLNQKLIRFFDEGVESRQLKALDYQLFAPVFHGTILSTAKHHISGRYKFDRQKLMNVAQIIWDGVKLQD